MIDNEIYQSKKNLPKNPLRNGLRFLLLRLAMTPEKKDSNKISHCEEFVEFRGNLFGFGRSRSNSEISASKKTVIMQILPRLETGGVERGTIDIAKAIIDSGFIAIIVAEYGKMADELKKIGAIYIDLPVGRKNPFYFIKMIFAVRKILKNYQVDIIHARSRIPAWISYFANIGYNRRFITSFHGTYSCGNKIKKFYNKIMLKGEVIIAVSHFIKDHIITNYCQSNQALQDKIRVIHRGVDLAYFNPNKISENDVINLKKKWNIWQYNDKKIIILPGRVTRWKGHLEFLDAINNLKTQNFIVLIVGGYDNKDGYYNEIISKISEYNLQDKVFLVGDCREINVAYQISDIVVSASNRAEAFGRVMAEAGAMKKIVVATNHGGATEIIINETTGFLVNDKIEMGIRIEQILTMQEDEIIKMQNSAYEHIVNNFSLEKMQNKTMEIYNSILA